jgi:hypothetical protein
LRKTAIVTVLLYFLVFLSLPLFGSSMAQPSNPTWTLQTIDLSGDILLYNSLVLDSAGNPHVSYYDSTIASIKYAQWNGSSWNIQTVASFDGFGGFNSLALDSAGNPHISFCYTSSSGVNIILKYAYWTGSSWAIQSVDWGGEQNSIALDSKGNPHISYFGRSEGLKYASWDGSTWNIETVNKASCSPLSYTILALDAAGKPHISYCDYFNGLKYAFWDGSAWNIQVVDSTGGDSNFFLGNSFALDSAANPHITYFSGENNLRYAYWNGSAFDVQTVDTPAVSQVGFGSSVAVDFNGNTHLSYVTDDGLKYAELTGSGWNTQTVEQFSGSRNSFTIPHNCLVLDSQGNPHILYLNEKDELKYAYLTSPSQSTTTPPNSTQTPNPDIFNVQSNSTITGFYFDSAKQELNFNITGPSETIGCTNVTIAKSFLANVDNLKVYLDGNQISCNVTSNESEWLLTFTYHHSTHQVKISLSTEEISLNVTLAGLVVAVIFVVLTLAVLTAIVYGKKAKINKA